jgi:hypothetical protein
MVVLEMEYREAADLVHILRSHKMNLDRGTASGTSVEEEKALCLQFVYEISPITGQMEDEIADGKLRP